MDIHFFIVNDYRLFLIVIMKILNNICLYHNAYIFPNFVKPHIYGLLFMIFIDII